MQLSLCGSADAWVSALGRDPTPLRIVVLEPRTGLLDKDVLATLRNAQITKVAHRLPLEHGVLGGLAYGRAVKLRPPTASA